MPIPNLHPFDASQGRRPDSWLPWLVARLSQRFNGIDPAMINDAAEDALLEFLRRPGHFQSNDSLPPQDLLFVAAKRNLLDRIRSEARRKKRDLDLEKIFQIYFVELRPIPAIRLMEEQLTESRRELRERFLQMLSPEDQKVMDLWMHNERRTSEFARVLGLDGLAKPEQKRAVKRAKDRLKKALSRWLAKAASYEPERAAARASDPQHFRSSRCAGTQRAAPAPRFRVGRHQASVRPETAVSQDAISQPPESA